MLGIVSFSSDEINKVKGLKSDQLESILGYPTKSEIIHRDDMVKLVMKNYLNNIGIKSKNAFKNLGYVDLKKRNKVLETYLKSLKKNKK